MATFSETCALISTQFVAKQGHQKKWNSFGRIALIRLGFKIVPERANFGGF